MPEKLTYEFVRGQFEKEGYILVSSEYKNARFPMDLICEKGHKICITYDNFKAGKRCKFCSVNSPITYDIVKDEFNKRGYKLVSNEYIKSSEKLKYICPKGHEGMVSWNSFQQGHGCSRCYGNDKLTMEQVKKSFEEKGCQLLSNEYINSKEKLDYVCANGHIHSITWDNWRAGGGCNICAGNIKNEFDKIKSEFAKEGYVMLTEYYVNNKQKLKYKCPSGHIHNISYGKFKYGRRCPTCAIIKTTGPNNPAWKGGISYEPYCPIWKDKEYKETIKIRDNYKCINPYCDSKNPIDLTIHHIDYNKKNCGPNNLITVCRSCNNKANKDRSWHTAWYKALLKNRGIL